MVSCRHTTDREGEMTDITPMLVLDGSIVDIDKMSAMEGVGKSRIITALMSTERPFATHGYTNEYGVARRAFMSSSIHSLEETAALKAIALTRYRIP